MQGKQSKPVLPHEKPSPPKPSQLDLCEPCGSACWLLDPMSRHLISEEEKNQMSDDDDNDGDDAVEPKAASESEMSDEPMEGEHRVLHKADVNVFSCQKQGRSSVQKVKHTHTCMIHTRYELEPYIIM